MTTAAVKGNSMSLSIEGDILAESQSCALHFAQSTIDATSKDSDAWGDFLAGLKEWSVDFSAAYIHDDVAKKVLVNHFTNSSPAALTLIVTMPDGETYTGEAVLESMDIDGPNNELCTLSGSLKGKGALTASVS
jgi:predicted secreted protein